MKEHGDTPSSWPQRNGEMWTAKEFKIIVSKKLCELEENTLKKIQWNKEDNKCPKWGTKQRNWNYRKKKPEENSGAKKIIRNWNEKCKTASIELIT
jgi:hypothetical protein